MMDAESWKWIAIGAIAVAVTLFLAVVLSFVAPRAVAPVTTAIDQQILDIIRNDQ